jgi:hypothetical protein
VTSRQALTICPLKVCFRNVRVYQHAEFKQAECIRVIASKRRKDLSCKAVGVSLECGVSVL